MIDFATLQGLSIPEGVVTEITDAQGRVLWSLTSELPGTFYLRPSADISVDSTVTFAPFGATAAYSLLNEEVCDGASTYIGVSAAAAASQSGTARFAVSGNVPKKINKVTGFDVVVCADATAIGPSDEDGFPTILGQVDVYVIIDGTSYRLAFGSNPTWQVIGGQFASQNYVPLYASEETYNASWYEQAFDAIKAYVETNGSLPNIEIEFVIGGYYRAGETSSDGKSSTSASSGYGRVSQAYIVLDCE